MRDVVVIGFDKEVMDLVASVGDLRILGFADVREREPYCGWGWVGGDAAGRTLIASRAGTGGGTGAGIGAVMALDSPRLREEASAFYGTDHLLSVLSPRAERSPSARIGAGSVVQAGAVIGADAVLGAACKLHYGAVVHHDCRVGDFCCLAGGARLLGYVELGARVHVGAGAVILPRRRVGVGAVIGAGAVVTRDVPPGAVVAGVPARVLKRLRGEGDDA